MSLASDQAPRPDRAIDWPALMSELGPRFAARADNYDATDAFVAENFAELKARDVFAAGVPSETRTWWVRGGKCRPIRILFFRK